MSADEKKQVPQLKRVFALRGKMLAEAGRQEGRFTDDRVTAICRVVSSVAGVPHSSVDDTLRSLVGMYNVSTELYLFFWRVAACQAALRHGMPLHTIPFVDNPAVAQTLRYIHKRGPTTYELVWLTGRYAGKRWLHSLGGKPFYEMLAISGVSSRGRNPVWDKREFVGLRTIIVPREHGDIEFVAANTAIKKHNSRLMKIRRRVNGAECPRNYQFECVDCACGVTDCPAAVRPQRASYKKCERCNETRMFEENVGCIVCAKNL